MKKDESNLIGILRNDVRPDPVDDAAVEDSLREAVRAFRMPGNESRAGNPDHGRPFFSPGALSAAAAVALAVAAAAAAFGWWLKPDPIAAGPNPAALSRLLSEIEALFPAQVTAVVMNREEIDIQLTPESESRARPADQRIRLTFGREGNAVTALTYSGQRVELNLNGEIVPVTPLIQADGSVFIVTEDSVIHPSPEARLAGFEVTLARLPPQKLDGGGRS